MENKALLEAVNRAIEALEDVKRELERQEAAPAAPKGAFCMSCGAPLGPGDKFCMKCGAKV